MHMELIALQAKMSKARYDALRKAGFDAGDLLRLCTKPMEL